MNWPEHRAAGDDPRDEAEQFAAIQDELDRQREAEIQPPLWLLWVGVGIGVAAILFGLATAVWG